MNRTYLLFAILIVGVIAVAALVLSLKHDIVPIQTRSSISSMRLDSADFAEGGAIPSDFTCDGAGISPELRISDVPDGAKSLALILHDPDAPHDFVHWAFWNADPATTEVKEGGAPPGAVEGNNGAGKPGYAGLCPPSGTHHYVFELFALDTMLDIPDTTDAPGLRTAMQGHVLDTTRLTGTYSKQ